jgi:hypothetical protein
MVELFSEDIIKKGGLPRWIVVWNYIGIIPTLIIWPVMLFVSIFMFDNPSNFTGATSQFIAVNSYPILMLLNMRLSLKIYKVTRPLSIFLPLIPLIALRITCYYFLGK